MDLIFHGRVSYKFLGINKFGFLRSNTRYGQDFFRSDFFLNRLLFYPNTFITKRYSAIDPYLKERFLYVQIPELNRYLNMRKIFYSYSPNKLLHRFYGFPKYDLVGTYGGNSFFHTFTMRGSFFNSSMDPFAVQDLIST